jgi:hypothetical protein
MPKGNLPRISCLRKYAKLSFNFWLTHKDEMVEANGASAELMCRKLCLPEKSKWTRDGFFRFFQFKEDQGGRQGLS